MNPLPAHGQAHFETLFQHSDDPWKFRTRWYEARKRAVTLACLPAQRFVHGYEPGCANGELSAALAARCERLLVSDGSSHAVALARTRLAALPHVQVIEAWLPQAWPQEHFDLIVISELGYFLEPCHARCAGRQGPGHAAARRHAAGLPLAASDRAVHAGR